MTMSWPSSRLQVTRGCGNPLALHERRAIPPSGISTSPPPSSFSMSGGMTTSREAVYISAKEKKRKENQNSLSAFLLFPWCCCYLRHSRETVNVFFHPLCTGARYYGRGGRNKRPKDLTRWLHTLRRINGHLFSMFRCLAFFFSFVTSHFPCTLDGIHQAHSFRLPLKRPFLSSATLNITCTRKPSELCSLAHIISTLPGLKYFQRVV
jgi:hypothetical protein